MSEDLSLPLTTPNTRASFAPEYIPKKPMKIVDLTVEIPATARSTSLPNENIKRPSRWGTLEFKFYYVVVAVVVPYMMWIPASLSTPSNPNYNLYHSRLAEGWLFGRQIDNSDSQYRSFRNNVPILTTVAGIFLALKFAWTRIHASNALQQGNLHLIPFNVVFSLLFLLGLHGASILKVIAILTCNYIIAKSCKDRKIGPVITWAFNVGILFLNDKYNGYSFGEMLPSLAFLDEYEGFYPRWHVSFNITMLRLVSFNLDYYWACRKVGPSETGSSLNEKQRQGVSHPVELYSYMNYICYALYAPLYIAGPIITFNDFLWQYRRPTVITRSSTLGYLVRFIGCFLTMEFILHYMYVVAIKDTRAWIGDTPSQISMIGFWNLMIVWLKLLLPWRFFRLWALVDGIDPPENMVRCMANNYSTFGFWRSWHRSYNLWIIRYIYIPLGGIRNVFVNSVLVFTFVALWHDLTFKLLAWGWLVSLFIIPEMSARYLLPPNRYSAEPWYRHVCALGAVFNILLMMTANLVGFVIGTDGIRFFLDQIFGTFAGFQFLLGTICCLFVAAQLMFEYREEEMRSGIYRRC